MEQDSDSARPEEDVKATEAPSRSLRVIAAEDLFGQEREILIEFHGECYRLRITRRNKLILQK